MRAIGVTLLLASVLAVPPARADGNYGPLSTGQYHAFVGENLRLGQCMRDSIVELGEQQVAERIIAAGGATGLLAAAGRLLAGEPGYAPAIESAGSEAAKIRVALASLQARAAAGNLSIPGLLRLHGLVVRYRAMATAPACQPSPEFLSSLKVLLDEHH